MKTDFYAREGLSSNDESAPRVIVEDGLARIDAEGIHYRDLNALLKRLKSNGVTRVEIHNLYGQRYIGTGVDGNLEIEIYGTAGNDLGAFMDGPRIKVYGNVQDGCGNTMNNGLIVVHGHAGDVVGYSMRGGKIFIRDYVGYRASIHMKEYRDIRPFIVIGGSTRDFLGEYMAGGVILVLGLNLRDGENRGAKFVGTGMHGGVIYVRGEITHLGQEAEVMNVDEKDMRLIQDLVSEFCNHFGFNLDEIMSKEFTKIVPVSIRPYGRLYAYSVKMDSHRKV